MSKSLFLPLSVMALCHVVHDARLWSDSCNKIEFVTRAEWGARPPRHTSIFPRQPVGMLFVHHTEMAYCFDKEQCIHEMRVIQDFHMDVRGWDDIGYNFLVGEDGRVYEGRGWNLVGAQVKNYNSVSLGVSVMGNFSLRVPNAMAIDALTHLLTCAVEINKLSTDYRLYGHRQAIGTNKTCPGQAFYELIETWPHHDSHTPLVPWSQNMPWRQSNSIIEQW